LMLRDTITSRYVIQGKRVRGDAAIEKFMSGYSMDVCALKRYIA
jgi:hypothetical protein